MNAINVQFVVSVILFIVGVYSIFYSLTAKTSIPRDKTKPPIIKDGEIFVLGIILLLSGIINAYPLISEFL